MAQVQQLGERIANLLAAEGIGAFYSLPEVTFGILHDALDKLGIPLIAPRHETAAGHMAEADCLINGRIAVAAGSVGPGTVNLYPAVAHSHIENLPVLYLGSERTLVGRSSPRRSKFQCPPSVDVLRPVTKWATVLEDGRMVDDVFQEAFRQLRIGTPGPVYIGLPFDMLLETFEYPDLAPISQYRPASEALSVPDDAIQAAADLLKSAKRPILLVGGGVKLAKAQRHIDLLAKKLATPVVLTHGGRGVLPDTHSHVADFGVGPGAEVSRDADVVFAVGTSISERSYFGGNPYFEGQACGQQYFGSAGVQKWIHLDQDPTAIGRNRTIDLALIGNMRLGLPRLIDALREYEPPAIRTEALATHRQRRSEYYHDLYATVRPCDSVHPGQLILEVQKCLPEDVIMVKDGGAISIWHMNFQQHAISNFISPGKMGQLGAGLPYANAAALTAQTDGRRVCLITGDGAFGFYPMELETSVRLNLPVLIIVGYDQGWSLEIPYYEHVTGRTFAVDHAPSRLDQMAISLGAHGEFCSKPDEIRPAIERSLSSGKPALVQVAIDQRINAFEMPNDQVWTGWHADKEIYLTSSTED